MLRSTLIGKHADHVDGFRWRSREVTRIEGFSDAVFGFAITLLIVSLEVPRTSTELLATMRGFGSFVITFVILASLWYAQYLFFRRYGLEDRVTVLLNLALLFTVLFFVFPLKFLFGLLLGDPSLRKAKVMTPHGLEPVVLPEHRPIIFLIFGLGFAAVFIVFLLLYRHAWSQRDALGLNEFELAETKFAIRRVKLAMFVGATYCVMAANQLLEQSKANQRAAEVLDFIVLAVFLGIMVMMGKLIRERRMRKRDWLSRLPEISDPPEDPSPS